MPEAGEQAAFRRVTWGLMAVAVAMRLWNAWHYRPGLGFDAAQNLEYIQMLMRSWMLPAPDAAWSTAHPPLFYYMSALLGRLAEVAGARQLTPFLIASLVSAAGIGIAVLARRLVLRHAPGDERRACIAAGLVLFLPAHVYMSPMANEELLAAFFTSLAIVGCAESAGRTTPRVAARIGADAGFALLTKLSGAMTIAACGASLLLEGLRRKSLGEAIRKAAIVAGAAVLIGGWFYVRNWIGWGYLYPKDLPQHAIMFEMPPGERALFDYVRFPLSTFTDPQLLDPGLLHSVWGGTYATLYFDGHRHFLPRSELAVRRTGTFLLVLGLLPCAAAAMGLARGVRRAGRETAGPDVPLLLLSAFTLAGYVLFTWRNPQFVTVKAPYLLGLCVPFAFYASEVLADWSRARAPLAKAVLPWLAVLFVAVAVTFTIGLAFEKREGPGLPWQAAGAVGSDTEHAVPGEVR